MTLTIRYNQLMERLVLSQEAAERILAAAQSQAAGTSRPASRRAPSRSSLPGAYGLLLSAAAQAAPDGESSGGKALLCGGI